MSPPCLGGKIIETIGMPERRAVDQRGVPGKRGLVNCDMFVFDTNVWMYASVV